jgi:2-iminobutanoate/2-iminopropanoate deaminase
VSTPLRVIRTEHAPAPVAGAPYSQAIAAPPGQFVFVSGQVPVDAATGQLVADDITVQTRQVLANVAAVLAGADATLADVVKSTVFLADLGGDFAQMNAAYAEAFGAHAPARSTIGVAALPLGARVEIEVVARTGGTSAPASR